jgi:hypothetical protein
MVHVQPRHKPHFSPTGMTSDIAHRTLWCLIESNPSPFEVTAPANASVDHLKRLVQKERKNGALRNVDASDLVLWKVGVL